MPEEGAAKPRYEHPLPPREPQEQYRERGDWEGVTLAQIVEGWAVCDPDRPVVLGPTPLSYGELWDRARCVAGALEDAGLRPGEFLVAVTSNCAEWLVLEVGASIAAAILAPYSAHLSPAEATSVFEQLDARGLILEADLLGKPGWPEAMDELRDRLSDRPVWPHGDGPCGDRRRSLAAHARGCDRRRPSTGTGRAGSRTAMHFPRDWRDHGRSEEHRAFVGDAGVRGPAFRRDRRLCGGRRDVAIAPYGHAGGSVFEMYMPLLHGASILPIARWRPAEVVQAIERYGGTFFIAMGTHLYDLLALDPSLGPRLRSMRLVATGVGPDELFVNADCFFKVVRVYGCSEAPGHAFGRLDDRPEVRLHQDGIPSDGMGWRIVDAYGNHVSARDDRRVPMPEPEHVHGLLRAGRPHRGGANRGRLLQERRPDGRERRRVRQLDRALEGHHPAGRPSDRSDRHRRDALASSADRDRRSRWPARPPAGERAVIVAAPQDSGERADRDGLCAYLQQEGLPKQSLPERLVYVSDPPADGRRQGPSRRGEANDPREP
jgi:AMP-binding enzyme